MHQFSFPSISTAAVIVASTLVLACGGGSASAPSIPVSRLDESSCPYKLEASQKLGTTVRCGVLIVAQDRSSSSNTTIRLPFIVFKSPTASTLAPIIYLTGGPGQAWADTVSTIRSVDSPGFAGGAKLPRDEVLIEQRGAATSSPALACTPVAWGPEMFRDWATAIAAALTGVTSCASVLTANGTLPAAFNTNELAADVNDLRRLLGYNKVVLNGVSYGTNWALAVLRDYPDSVQSAVLDSVVAQSLRPALSAAEGTDKSFKAVADVCAADPTCNAAYPNLDLRISALLSGLNTTPLIWQRGPGKQFTAASATGVLFSQAMFSQDQFPYTVAVLESALAGAFTLDDLPVQQQDNLVEQAREFDTFSSPTVGQYLSINCADNASVTKAELDAAVLRVRPALQPTVHGSLNTFYSACQAWPYRKNLPASTYAPVTSGVPVLLLSGALDPSTQPAWAKQVAKTLSNSTLVSFPKRGHSVQSLSQCAQSLVAAFLAGQAVNPACAAAETLSFRPL